MNDPQGKFVSYILGSFARQYFNTTGSIEHVNTISRGTGPFKRIGRCCYLTHFEMRTWLVAGTSNYENFGEIALVWDRYPDQLLPAITDIWETGDSRSLRRTENYDRFEIIHQEQFDFCGCSAAGGLFTEKISQHADWSIPLPRLKTQYTTADALGTVSDTINGALYVITRGCVPAAFNAYHEMTCRTWFED